MYLAGRKCILGSVLCLLCLCARLFICALGSPAGKGLTSWLSFVVSTVSLSLSHWYPGSGVVLDCNVFSKNPAYDNINPIQANGIIYKATYNKVSGMVHYIYIHVLRGHRL